MIRYVIRCDKTHKYEAWFRSKADCERLLVSGQIDCPRCERRAGEVGASAPPAGRTGLAGCRAIQRQTAH